MTSFIDQVAEQIMHHEGVRLAVYDDATGKPIVAGDTVQGNPTIGVGRLLTDDRGITEDEVMMLLRNDQLPAARSNCLKTQSHPTCAQMWCFSAL